MCARQAHEDEFTGRKKQLSPLTKILSQLEVLNCPTDRLAVLRSTYADLEAAFDKLEAAAETYSADLVLALERQKQLDQMRLKFATKAEGLKTAIEDTVDSMTEVLLVSTPSEADDEAAANLELRADLQTHRDGTGSLQGFFSEMLNAGAGTSNPYSRFTVDDLKAMLERAEGAADERDASLQKEREKITFIDSKKREFAEAADAALTYIATQREVVEALGLPATIHPDDQKAIAGGNAYLAASASFADGAPERATHLNGAQECSDALMALAEVDNQYTKHTMPTLKAALNGLERLVQDRRMLVEGQLARAQTDITPEQHAELKEAFGHFDHSGDGR